MRTVKVVWREEGVEFKVASLKYFWASNKVSLALSNLYFATSLNSCFTIGFLLCLYSSEVALFLPEGNSKTFYFPR